ncbi:phage tail protein [Labrys sp. WJW]|uniref:phage tail protein n=1 Tax=Labrys sp. WJW TaxID=1737983 RepID=UPI00082EA95B|nr:phage tail protein [Labrys sp. WJW]OCC05104.1 phage tail protein [Labrys sp. WJW]
MSTPTFGMSITSVDNEPLPAITSNMSGVGIVGVAPDADAAEFPYDQPVTFFSNDAGKLAKLGKAGTIYRAIQAINAQLGQLQVAAQVVVVRVQPGANTAQTIANLRGDINARTGMFALLDAGEELGITPRLICVPGFTSQNVGYVSAVSLTANGSKLTEAPTISFTGGGSDPNKILPTAHAVMGDGTTGPVDTVVSVVIDTVGANLSGVVTATFAGGGNAADKALPTATVTVDTGSNAIIASLGGLLDQLMAVSVVDGPATTMTDGIAWRSTISSKRIIPVDPAAKILDEAGNIVVVPMSPYIIGVAVRRDHEFNGRPFRSWANQPINGIVGVSRPISFSILDGANEGQTLLSHNIGVVVRGNSTDGAIGDGGYVYVGTDTCSPDELWQFYNQVRGRDYIHLIFIKTLRYYLGRFNITGQALQAVLNTMEFALRDLKADDDILGYKIRFDTTSNSPEKLRQGKIFIGFAAEEPAPLRFIGLSSARYRPALDTLLTDLMSQLDLAA